MKILLVRPLVLNGLTFSRAIDCEPLELEYLYTTCKQVNATAVIYDGVTEKRRFSKVIRAENPDIVAITGYITQENAIKRYLYLVKKYCPTCKTILGGVHAQLNYKRLYFNNVDFIMRSESPRDFKQLITSINAGKGFSEINGLCYLENAQFKENKYTPFDISTLPIPERVCLKNNPKAYRYLDFDSTALLKTAVSCPHKCNFCYCTTLHGGIYQACSVDKIIEEIKTIEANSIFIVDSDFLVSEIRLREFVNKIKINNIKKQFVCYARADFIAAHPDLIKELCGIGFYYFLVGIESINDTTLNEYDKKTSTDINKACIRIIAENSAVCIALMIIDLSFKKHDFKNLYLWAKKNNLKYVSAQIYTPIPPTAIYNRAAENLITKNPKKWDLMHLVIKPKNISVPVFYILYRILLIKLYLLARKRGGYKFIDFHYVLKSCLSFLQRMFIKT